MKKNLLAVCLSFFIISCNSDDSPAVKSNKVENPAGKSEPTDNGGSNNGDNSNGGGDTDNGNTDTKKPDEYHMGNRSYAEWKKGINYIDDFDIESLIENPNNPKFNTEYFSQFVNIHSSNPNGEDFYTFEAEDYKNVQIEDLSYDLVGNYIRFKTSYKGVKSSIQSSLKFDLSVYFNQKITVDQDFVRSHYMRGIHENIAGFIGNLLNYDENKYEIDLSSAGSRSDNQNTLNFSISVTDKKTNRFLTTVQKNISGFKPLSDLSTELSISSTNILSEELQKRIDKNARNRSLLELLSPSVSEWMKAANFYIGGIQLAWRDDHYTGSGYLDLYIGSPHFELLSATKEGDNLLLKVKITQINEVSTNLVYNLKVPIH